MNSILDDMIGQSEDMIGQLLMQSEELAKAIKFEVTSKRILREAEQALTQAESEFLVEAEMQAQVKDGPLAGVAKTSSAYKVICETIIAAAHRNGIRDLFAQVQKLRIEADNCQIRREQCAVRFSALKHAVDNRTAVLVALNG